MASPIRAPMDIEPLGNIGGLLTPREDFVPNIQSAYGAIIQNAPDYQYFTAPLSNQGRATASYGTTNQIVVAPDTPIRLVNNATGEVVSSGTGYAGAQAAIDAANALASSEGKKANYDIQVVRPGGQTFESVSTERPDVSGLGILADVALPVAASLLVPGGGFLGTILPAAAGSAVSSVAQGRNLENTLLRAALAGGGAGLGELAFAPAQVASQATTQAATQAGTQAAGQAATQAAASAVPSAVGDIVVTALGGIPAAVGGAFGGLATSLLPSVFDAAQLNNIATVDQLTPAEPPSDYVLTAQLPGAPVVPTPGIIPPAGTTPTVPAPNPAEDLLLTAQTQTQPVVPTPVVIPPVAPPAPPPNPAEDIVATAQTQPINLLPAALLTPAAVAAAATANAAGATTTAAEQAATRTTPTAEETAALNAGAGAGGVLGTGLTATQLATLGSLGISGLSSLFSGGTGTTPTTPYVSPFGGLGGGLGGGMDFRATPAIADYERYGFGPEATFFRPEYNRLVGTGASLIPSYAQNMQQQPQTANIGQPQIYAASSQPVADRSAYLNNLFRQIDTQVSQGLLAGSQAQDIQKELRKTYINPQSTTEQLQNVYNTQIQQYRPLI